jgi:hypothetical protein
MPKKGGEHVFPNSRLRVTDQFSANWPRPSKAVFDLGSPKYHLFTISPRVIYRFAALAVFAREAASLMSCRKARSQK